MPDVENKSPEQEALEEQAARQAAKTPKIIRVLTVCGYLCVVSTAAIMLSGYYIFLWNPKVSTPPVQVRKH